VSKRRRLDRPDPAHLERLRAIVTDGAEQRPAVYHMIAADGEVLYVGKSKSLRARLLSYFRGSWPADKGMRILAATDRIEWTYVANEFAALREELQLIKKWRPRSNVMGKRDARHYAFIRLTAGAAPRLQVVRGAGDGRGMFYGPFVGAVRLGESVRELADALGLRDCTLDRRMGFDDQQELWQADDRTPGCIRYEIRRCLGPCISACSSTAYDERVQLARAFLDGRDDTPLEALRTQMAAASDALEFERAAALRDKLQRLEGLRESFARLRFAVETLTFAYPVKGHFGDDRIYLVRRGRVVEDLPANGRLDDVAALAELAGTIEAQAGARGTAIPPHEIDELLLLSSWFRTHPGELARAVRADGTRAQALADSA
jgi:excinuclease ABC subunit C